MEASRTLRDAAQAAIDDVMTKGRMRAFRILKSGVLTIPAPALLSVLSGSPAAIGGTAALTLAGLLLLIWPSGIAGLLLCLLVWSGSLALAACGLQVAQHQKRIDELEEEMAGLRETRQVWERDLLSRVKTDADPR